MENTLLLYIAAIAVVYAASTIKDKSVEVNIDWHGSTFESKTSTTLQVVVNPLILRNSSIHDNAFDSLSTVSSDYVRFVPWFPYPKLVVPELQPPKLSGGTCTTSWNFTYMDEMMEDFYKATPGVKHIINFSTTPDWMWATDTQYTYPEDINTIDFSYNNGTKLKDPTLKELSNYYARLVSWYVNGGFTDECGLYHHSGHHFEIEYWEVLNEPEAEHTIRPDLYNRIYDAVVTAIHKVSPSTKFVGLALAFRNYSYIESFLTPENHEPGIPIDFISYHFYAGPEQASQPKEAVQSYMQADRFIAEVKRIENLREKLAPSVRTTLDEIGTFDPKGTTTIVPGYVEPDTYWVWSGGVYAYVFSHVANMGIDVVGESQLVGYPGQFPSVSMVNYTTGAPNARLRTLQLLQKNFKPGDTLLETTATDHIVRAQAFRCADGIKLLLINKGSDTIDIHILSHNGFHVEMVDVESGGGPWKLMNVDGQVFKISPYATAVLHPK